MAARKRCEKRGHRFKDYSSGEIPYWFCSRFFCDASIVAPWVDAETARKLEAGIPPSLRVVRDDDEEGGKRDRG